MASGELAASQSSRCGNLTRSELTFQVASFTNALLRRVLAARAGLAGEPCAGVAGAVERRMPGALVEAANLRLAHDQEGHRKRARGLEERVLVFLARLRVLLRERHAALAEQCPPVVAEVAAVAAGIERDRVALRGHLGGVGHLLIGAGAAAAHAALAHALRVGGR